MSGPRGERCGDCYFWDPVDAGIGTCRKGPPRMDETSSSGEGVWPLTGGVDVWCGEFWSFPLKTAAELPDAG